MTPHTIYIVDDHPLIREGLTRLIAQEDDLAVAGTAGTAAEARLGIAALKPDLAVIDITLQDANGIDLTRELLIADPTLKVLMVTMYTAAIYAERSLEAGAKGFLTKQEGIDDVIFAIRTVLAGKLYINRVLSDTLLQKVFLKGAVPANGSGHVRLSKRELEVLELLGQGLSTRQIAKRLFISIKTVESHNAHIKEKLQLSNGHALMQHAMQWTNSNR